MGGGPPVPLQLQQGSSSSSSSSSSNKTVNRPMLVATLRKKVEKDELQARLRKARMVSPGMSFAEAVMPPTKRPRSACQPDMEPFMQAIAAMYSDMHQKAGSRRFQIRS
jgi:hypothetical protein